MRARTRAPRAATPRARPRTTPRSRARATARASTRDDDGVLGKLRRLNPFAKKSTARERKDAPTRDLVDAALSKRSFGDGLMGKLMGEAVNAAAGALRDRFRESAAARDALYDEATRAVRVDRALADALGGERIECGPMEMQSSVSSSANGATRTRVTIGFRARTPSGRSAFVRASGDGDGAFECAARLDDGRALAIGAAREAGDFLGDARDAVIDVEID